MAAALIDKWLTSSIYSCQLLWRSDRVVLWRVPMAAELTGKMHHQSCRDRIGEKFAAGAGASSPSELSKSILDSSDRYCEPGSDLLVGQAVGC